MILVAEPRCCECGRPQRVIEPFTGGVCQQVRCDGCGVYLRIGRVAQGWTICTNNEARQQRTAPLPAVVHRGRYSLSRVLRTLLRVLQPCEGLAPGESSFPQLAPPVAQAVEPQARPVEVSSVVVHGAASGVISKEPALPITHQTTGMRAPEPA